MWSADFRSADVKAGGEGAPLAPVYHAAMAAGLERPLMILNWGGVGNVTYLGAQGRDHRLRHRPGQCADRRFSHPQGEDWPSTTTGRSAASGRVDPAALAMLMGDPYFDRPAPKSLDRNHFSALAACVESLSDADGAATLSAFTVEFDRGGASACPAGAGALAGRRRRTAEPEPHAPA